jgi:hypothetical protein
MGIAISPKHVVPPGFPRQEEWSLELKIDVFLARIDGWHLEVADRCINGWENPDGQPCINAIHNGLKLKHIPDSGWAVLQIVLNYFEIIGLFKFFKKSKVKDRQFLFEKGVFDVFPEFSGQKPNIAGILYSDLRGGLYHAGMKSGRIFLRHAEPPLALRYDHQNNLLVVDPHVFVPRLRQHLAEYGERLRHPDETALRAKFDAAYQIYYIE